MKEIKDSAVCFPSPSIPSISEDAARRALIKYAAEHVTYSKRPAEEMVFKELIPYNMYRVCAHLLMWV